MEAKVEASADHTPTHFASIQEFGPEERGHALSWTYQLLTFLGSMGLHVMLTLFVIGSLINLLRMALTFPALGVWEMVLGGVWVLAGCIVGACQLGLICTYEEWPFHLWLGSRLRNAVAARSAPVVSANDRDARVCEVVPRERWHKIRLETATDVVLTRMDANGLWMEGDRCRYHFSPESILGVMPHEFKPPGAFSTLHVVLLYVRTESGPIELPLLHRDFPLGQLSSGKRRADRDRMLEQLSAISRGSEFEPAAAPVVDAVQYAPPSNNPYATPSIL